MNLTQFEPLKTELKRITTEIKRTSGNTVINCIFYLVFYLELPYEHSHAKLLVATHDGGERGLSWGLANRAARGTAGRCKATAARPAREMG